MFSKPRLTFCPSSFFTSSKRNLSNQKIQQRYSYQMKRSTYLNVALGCFVFAICFAGIPIYRTFCQHMGLVGDNDKKEYTFKESKINNLKKFHVQFSGESDPKLQWEFEPVEKEVIVGAAETAIVFYRLYNKEDKPIVGFSTYNISPEDCNLYFSKIQCFCFNQQLINPKEELLLPLFFYLEPEINEDTDVNRVQNIQVAYTFLKSAKQNLAVFAAQELKRIENNKNRLNEIRAKKMDMSLDQYLDHLDKQQPHEEVEESCKLRQDNSEEIERLKRISDFEADLVKAEMIAQQFESPEKKTTYSKTQASAAS